LLLGLLSDTHRQPGEGVPAQPPPLGQDQSLRQVLVSAIKLQHEITEDVFKRGLALIRAERVHINEEIERQRGLLAKVRTIGRRSLAWWT